ncbi:uncharacterized protein PRCAT00006243001 [Priceomyces carsonii]|uniref:uncharacterized protein n=1 Tax=Priceomyces carsonii TaxID=28549 RepID=UPI002EDA6DFA|nr:unnamed protein product [Priceomyces carsonii]
MYNPYGNTEAYLPLAYDQQNLHHPQPHHAAYQQGYQQQGRQQQQHPQQQQQQQQPGFQQLNFVQQGYQQQGAVSGLRDGPGGDGAGIGGNAGQGGQFPNFLNDPAAALASQFAKNGFNTSNQYIQQNFGLFIGGTSDLKYYFLVSNSYVLRKLLIVLFPYHNKTWGRLSTTDIQGDSSSLLQFATPLYDVNAPDLYIPLMSFVTYILLWACFQGLKGDFHPQVFGYLASQTVACSFLDILIFKVGLYLLNCSTQSSIWDLISFSGYKYVSIIVLLCWKHLFGNGWFTYYPVVFFLITNLAVFLMRSLKFLVLPNSIDGTATNSVTAKQRKIRIQFLFLYSVVVQGIVILFMGR